METSKDLPPAGLGLLPSYTIAGKLKHSFMRQITNIIVFGSATKLFKTILQQYKIKAPQGNVFDVAYRTASLVLQIGVPGFEYPRTDLNKRIHFIGALLPHTRKKNKYQLPLRYKRFDKKVLVTQGTVEKDIQKILVPTLEAFKNTDVLVIATTGGSQTQILKERYADENFIIEDFIPFNDVMHECDVYITNGGYGGVMLAISNELPMVTAGVHEGKNEINARVEYFKLGINLRTETPSPDQIRKSVETILENSEYKNNVTKLSKEFRQYNALLLCQKYIDEAFTSPKNTGTVNKNLHTENVS
jgi:UDP:flavonoid glycosyltransferase YjiC (YdhE family)